MSSPKGAKAPARKASKAPARAAAKKAPASKKAAPRKVAPASGDGEPSPAQKAAFLKALAGGVKPNSAALRKLEEKKGGAFAPSAPAPARKVEVLRRIPAPASVAETPETKDALRIAAMIEACLARDELGKVQPHAQQALAAALCRLYAANHEMGERYPILTVREAPVTATDVMVMCGALLKAVDLQVFELGMWQSWSSG
jgi:hypothetical protein